MILIFIFFIIPVLIIAGFVVFLSLGITDLVMGFRLINGQRNKNRIIRGFIFLGVDYLIVAAIIVLAIYISLVPISFM